jgi:beta-glucosidase
MKKTAVAIALLLGLAVLSVMSQTTASEKRVEDILGRMTLEEKIDFIGGTQGYSVRGDSSLGIPQLLTADGPVGVRGKSPSTAYPASICLAASWDTAMAARVGAGIGMEARSKNTAIMLGPAMNMHRAPMCGRNFEYLGEDPFLAGKIAASYILGLQRQGVMATAKHYLGNDQEYDRNNVSSDMDERTLREIYLPAFKAAVTEGKVAAVMTSYNLVNGVHASQNDFIINKILKDEWKFDGFVMSDWGSINDVVRSTNGGLDLEMPSGRFMCRDSLLPAIQSGKVLQSTIDDKVRRILRQEGRFGLLGRPDVSKVASLDSAFTRSAALDAARGGTVLLKNDGGMLPLDPKKIRSIAVIGPNAHPAVTGGGGSSSVMPAHSLSLFEALQRVAGPDIKVTLEPGSISGGQESPEFFDRTEFYTLVNGKPVPGLKGEFFSKRWPQGKPDYETIFPGLNRVFSDSLPGIAGNNFFARFSGILKVQQSGLYRFVVSSDGGYRLTVDKKPVVGTWWGQKETSKSGLVSLEAGKEYPVELGYNQRRGTGVIRLGYDAPEAVERKFAEVYDRVRGIAQSHDCVVLSLGFNGETETEGADRPFQLSAEQERLAAEVLKTGRDEIVVLNAGGNVDMSGWLPKTRALVHAWYPGQEGNLAVAEILFGVINPSGKLPVSFEKRWEDNATFNSYYDTDGDKHVAFSEGVFLGYRHFDSHGVEPLFPFGFGLSYTTFEFGDLKVKGKKSRSTEPVEVKVRVRNTGRREGAEIVQLYVEDPVAGVPRPAKELKAFAKVWLKPGESRDVSFTLHEDAFQFFHPDKRRWMTEPGEFTLLVGESSRDIRAKQTIRKVE